jgi:hypothetical protein
MTFILDRKVGDLKTWELYVGFVLLQIIIGIAVTLLVGVFDLAGIKGALMAVLKQFAILMNAQPPQKYITPIASELKEGKYI